MGWQAGYLSVCFIVGTVIQGLVILNNPSYIPERWHGTLMVWAITAFCVIVNTAAVKKLPGLQVAVSLIHILGLFAVVIPLWVLSPRASGREALLTYTNGGGWPTTGLSAIISLLSPVGSLTGFNYAVHMGRSDVPLADAILADPVPSGGG
ncbi:MAG: hypothetical protein Q9183_002093 [Haloplaca sp. 2 TL-2023]